MLQAGQMGSRFQPTPQVPRVVTALPGTISGKEPNLLFPYTLPSRPLGMRRLCVPFRFWGGERSGTRVRNSFTWHCLVFS